MEGEGQLGIKGIVMPYLETLGKGADLGRVQSEAS